MCSLIEALILVASSVAMLPPPPPVLEWPKVLLALLAYGLMAHHYWPRRGEEGRK